MDLKALRSAIGAGFQEMSQNHSGTVIAEVCERELAVPYLFESGTSKASKIAASLEAVADDRLVDIAKKFVVSPKCGEKGRYAIREILWANDGPKISQRHRREIAKAMRVEELYDDAKAFDALISDLFVIESNPLAQLFGAPDETLRGRIHRHVFAHPGDMSTEELFRELGALECSDRRFALLIEGIVSRHVWPDVAAIKGLAASVNAALAGSEAEFREDGEEEGYPHFVIVSRASSRNRGAPKNLIFASRTKPDLRFRDAVDNELEVMNDGGALFYDRVIGPSGLTWRELQTWWAETRNVSEAAAKLALYQHLRASLPLNSPPQELLFKTFYSAFRDHIPNLPALLPEVWLHWDPKNAQVRGREALLRSRMDFLMLLPDGARVVIEVDGKQHYSDDDEKADPQRYAMMVRADRDLRLVGYEVYRFGGAELQDDEPSRKRVAEFFGHLFERHSVSAAK